METRRSLRRVAALEVSTKAASKRSVLVGWLRNLWVPGGAGGVEPPDWSPQPIRRGDADHLTCFQEEGLVFLLQLNWFEARIKEAVVDRWLRQGRGCGAAVAACRGRRGGALLRGVAVAGWTG